VIYNRNMTQIATYWPFTGVNEYSESQFGAPVGVQCRWEDKAVLFRNAQGQEATSQSIVYVASNVENKGYLKLGIDATANPIGLDGAFEIQQVSKSPHLHGHTTLIKVYL